MTCLSIASLLPLSAAGQESCNDSQNAPSLPSYEEIFELIQKRLPNISEQDLQHAALQGILTEFQSQIELESKVSEDSTKPSIAKSEILADQIAYVRLHIVSAGLSKILREEIETLRIEKGANGIVLDLRYAYGSDYAEVLRLAGIFLDQNLELINWGDGNQKAITQDPTIKLPMVVLINESTKGAAEALAGAFKFAKTGAVIGRPTPGQTQFRESIPLSSGHFLSIATKNISLADGTPLTGVGVDPDIFVDVSPAAQAAHFDDPFGKLKENESSNQIERLNEAALMRRQKDANGDVEIEINTPPEDASRTGTQTTAIIDPILARGVDLLKGWSIFNKSGN